MNCQTFEQRLDDFLDGELPPAEMHEVSAHAAACAACAGTLEWSRRLQARATALPRERRPRRDLWPHIAERLDGSHARPGLGRRPWFRAIAAGVALVGVFAGGMLADRVLRESGEAVQPQLAQQSPSDNTRLPGVQEARRVLPASHVELIEGNNGAGLSASTEQELLQNLLLVNLAIRQVEAAAAEDPANASLRELLSSLYSQEHRILSQAERLRVAGQAPTRTGI